MKHFDILFVASSSNASPARGGRRRIVDIAHQTSKYNLNSGIICFLPFSQIKRGIYFLKYGRESLENESRVPVYYFPQLPLTRINFIYKFNIFFCSLLAALMVDFFQVKILYGHGSQAGRISNETKKYNKNLKVLTDFHGVASAESEYGSNKKPNHRLFNAIEKDEYLNLCQSDFVIYVSNNMKIYFEEKYSKSLENCEIVPCAISEIKIPESGTREKIRTNLNLSDEIVFVYLGSAVNYQLPDKICEFFKNIYEKINSSFLLIISHDRKIFENILVSLKIPDNKYKIVSTSHDEVFDYQQAGDIGLLLRDDSIVNRVSSPTKFAEYLLSGLPVITTDYVGDYSELVKKKNLGFIITLSSLDFDPDLQSFVFNVKENRELFQQHCLNFVSANLSWDVFGLNLHKIFLQFINKK